MIIEHEGERRRRAPKNEASPKPLDPNRSGLNREEGLNLYEARWCQVQNVRMLWNLGVSLCKLGGHPKGLSLTAASTAAGLGARGRPVAGRRSVGRCPRGARHQVRQTRHKLVFGRSCWNLNHDAVIRIGGEAPGRRAHSKPRLNDHVQSRVATTSDRRLQFVMTRCRTAETHLLFSPASVT
jgi:hypothetical protein